MELKKSWRSLDLRVICTVIYVGALLVWLAVGLTPAWATDYEVSTDMQIPAIGLDTDVTTVRPSGFELPTPETIVGRYAPRRNKTLLFGHSTTVFVGLAQVALGDEVIYDETRYEVRQIETLAKEEISMGRVLAEAEVETIVLMTCAGEDLGGGDATHRLIVTATVVR